jgi:hypothetical protein
MSRYFVNALVGTLTPMIESSLFACAGRKCPFFFLPSFLGCKALADDMLTRVVLRQACIVNGFWWMKSHLWLVPNMAQGAVHA